MIQSFILINFLNFKNLSLYIKTVLFIILPQNVLHWVCLRRFHWKYCIMNFARTKILTIHPSLSTQVVVTKWAELINARFNRSLLMSFPSINSSLRLKNYSVLQAYFWSNHYRPKTKLWKMFHTVAKSHALIRSSFLKQKASFSQAWNITRVFSTFHGLRTLSICTSVKQCFS